MFIEIKNIEKKYPNGNLVIKNFNLNIQKGDFITLLGPSGCGKTTLLKMIGGFESPTSGKILVNKIDIKNLPIQRRPTITCFQDYALFPNLNVEQNIGYGLKTIRKPIENIDKKILKNIEKKIVDASKKAESNIKLIMKEQKNIEKDIDKILNRLSKKQNVKEMYDLSEEEYEQLILNIEEEFEKNYDESIYKLISFKVKFYEFLNDIFNFFNINANINYVKKFKDNSSVNKNKMVNELLMMKDNWRKSRIVYNKIDKLKNYYNELDYEVSYWQNYPKIEQEWYEKKYATRKLTKQEMNEEVEKVIKLVGLENKNKMFPNELSGGMQQRTALARAIVTKPEILLLDEPMSALDSKVRKKTQIELKRLHKELGITFIMVTHDQEEALALSDQIVVISQGKIEQVGTPNEIYDKPANVWVAAFIGQANIFDGIIKNKHQIEINGTTFNYCKSYSNFKENEKVKIMIRPEDFDVVPKTKAFISVKVIDIVYKGLMWEVKCLWKDKIINIESINKVNQEQLINLVWDIEDMHLMEYPNEG